MYKKEENLIHLHDLAMMDPRYLSLAEEHKVLDARFKAAMEQLPKNQQDAIGDYLGLVGEMGRFMLLLACRKMKFET